MNTTYINHHKIYQIFKIKKSNKNYFKFEQDKLIKLLKQNTDKKKKINFVLVDGFGC